MNSAIMDEGLKYRAHAVEAIHVLAYSVDTISPHISPFKTKLGNLGRSWATVVNHGSWHTKKVRRNGRKKDAFIVKLKGYSIHAGHGWAADTTFLVHN